MNKAFTLIELLIVIVIIGILASALIPRVTGMQDRARASALFADMKAIEQAMIMTMQDEGRSVFWTEAEIGLGSSPTIQAIYDKTTGTMATFSDHLTAVPNNPFKSSQPYMYDYDGDVAASECGWSPGVNIIVLGILGKERVELVDRVMDKDISSGCGRFRYVTGSTDGGGYHMFDDGARRY